MPVHHLGYGVGVCKKCEKPRYFEMTSMSKWILIDEHTESSLLDDYMHYIQRFKTSRQSKPVGRCTECRHREEDLEGIVFPLEHPEIEGVVMRRYRETYPEYFAERDEKVRAMEAEVAEMKKTADAASSRRTNLLLGAGGLTFVALLASSYLPTLLGVETALIIGGALFLATVVAYVVLRARTPKPEPLRMKIEDRKRTIEAEKEFEVTEYPPEEVHEILRSILEPARTSKEGAAQEEPAE